MESQILRNTYREMRRRFADLNDPAHGWEHVKRVYKLALYIAQQEGADCFIVGMAALMHDLGRLVPEERGTHHADLSVRAATDILTAAGVDPEKQEAILYAISAHSFSREQGYEPRTLEACVVRDADRLDGLGAIGILRWAITGTIRRTPQTRTYHPDDPFAERHIPDDRLYMLDHFYTKLLKLNETTGTQTGRRLAQRRSDFMRLYLDELRRELDV